MSVNEPLGAALPQGRAFEFKTPTRPQIVVSDGRLAQIGLLGTVVMGSLISIAATRTDTLLPQGLQPIDAPGYGALAGPFRFIGFHLATGETMAALALTFACYVLATKYVSLVSARAAIAAIVALNVIVLLAPPMFSSDVFSYEAYARMFTIYGVNPYLQGPFTIHLDPVFGLVGAKWIQTPTAYGPLFTALSGVLGHASITVSTYIFKLTAALACLGTVAILWRSARVRGVDPVRGAVLFGLNPLVVLYGVGGGHNDLLMLLPMVAGIYAVLRSQDRKAGALFVTAAAVKLTGALVAPFAYAAPEIANGDGRRRAMLVGVGAATAAVMAVGFGLFGVGTLHLPLILSQIQSEGDWHSIPGFISTAMLLPGLANEVGVVLAVAFVACSARLLWHVWHGRLDWLEGAAWATVAILVSAGSLLPWYVAWLLPLVALCDRPRLVRVSMWLTAALLFITILGYFPNGSALFQV
ncbi:MAG TPA: polyprenol phosphomannose-dependent alpha 1,6 mannosyltransferase MptB [Solirubrobacteraceae bacterium]